MQEKLKINIKCRERFEPAVQAVEELKQQSEKEIILIAIDGKCASGKTTLGYYLQEIFDCNLFHMDDFFLQKEQRTKERLAEVGGNVDYERFKNEVLDFILQGKTVEYRPFSCHTMHIGNSLRINHRKLNIIEGSYSMHPYFGQSYALKLFTDISDDIQIERIRMRNGEENLERFQKEWIPKEKAYFEKFDIRRGCLIL
ncbi:MAG: hypothetical protein PHS74_02140 [Lachnospiraceae bacterium]|nr:hypothetical protein [Lachnospiraceae bacterium]